MSTKSPQSAKITTLLPLGLALILLLAGCFPWIARRPDIPPGSADQAEEVLRRYFQSLYEEDYPTATALYGGSYHVLSEYNPDLDPDDTAALWERACTVNGFQCLRVGEVRSALRSEAGEYILTVTFLTELRDTFQLGPCCGAEVTENPPLTEFDFRVAMDSSGEYQVLDLPVYVQ